MPPAPGWLLPIMRWRAMAREERARSTTRQRGRARCNFIFGTPREENTPLTRDARAGAKFRGERVVRVPCRLQRLVEVDYLAAGVTQTAGDALGDDFGDLFGGK